MLFPIQLNGTSNKLAEAGSGLSPSRQSLSLKESMEWTKIKPQHYLSGNFTLTECGAMVKLIALTASIERMPTPREMRAQVPQATCKGLAAALQGTGTTLIQVLDKVLEDVENIKNKRDISRDTSRRYTQKKKEKEAVIVSANDVSSDTTDKSRVDKIREDKTDKQKKEDWFVSVWDLYPAPRLGRKEALRHFTSTVKTDSDFERITRAVKRYRVSDTVMKGFVKNGGTWFNNWEDYVEEQLTVGEEIAEKKRQAEIGNKLKSMGLTT